MNNIENDIPKYKKKSTAKPPAKAKHKHVYEPCLIEHPADWWNKPHERKRYVRDFQFASYCPVCGKTDSADHDRWFMSVKKYHENGNSYIDVVHTEEAERELNPCTRTIPVFKSDYPWPKFVKIEKEGQNETLETN